MRKYQIQFSKSVKFYLLFLYYVVIILTVRLKDALMWHSVIIIKFQIQFVHGKILYCSKLFWVLEIFSIYMYVCMHGGSIEVHFLIDCPLYDDLCTILFITFKNNDPSFDNSPSIIKYITLMTSKHQHQLSNMVFNIYQRRKLFGVY